jgi:hypothetical protein
MKVTMKKLRASPDGIVQPGATVTVSRAEGEALIATRSAVAAQDDPAERGKTTTRKTTRRGKTEAKAE